MINATLNRTLKLWLKRWGKVAKYWQEIKTYVTQTYGPTTEEWKYYNEKSGWMMKLLLKKRNLLFFVPLQAGFKLSLIFGDRAVAEIMAGDIKEEIKERLKAAKNYMEGTGINVEVKTAGDVKTIKKLLDIKICQIAAG